MKLQVSIYLYLSLCVLIELNLLITNSNFKLLIRSGISCFQFQFQYLYFILFVDNKADIGFSVVHVSEDGSLPQVLPYKYVLEEAGMTPCVYCYHSSLRYVNVLILHE